MIFSFLYLLIFIGFTNANLYKRWQYDNTFDPDDVTDFTTQYDWKISRYWKWNLLSGQSPHFVVMAQPYLNGEPVPYTESGDGIFKYSGLVYSFELYPAGDVVDKGGKLTAGVDTFVNGYKRVSPSWSAVPGEINMSKWSPSDLIKEFGAVSDDSFSDGKPYRMLGSTFSKGQNCWDFSSIFFSRLEKYDEFNPDIPFGVII